jgi:hypothetical protein
VAAAFRRRAVLATAAGALLLLSGCSGLQKPEVERVATSFEDQNGDPEARCDLLISTARAAVEKQAQAPCSEAIGDLPLQGGGVRDVQVWGDQAQVRLDGDTLFLAETTGGWRVAAAGCSPRPNQPYDCEVEAP